MQTSTSMLAQNWGFSIFCISAFFLCILMLIGGALLGGKSYGRSKNIPFESGINPIGSSRLQISVKFYLIAMFFVIFDVETLYIYAWAISIREVGWIGLIEASIFIFVLLISLIYLIRVGALNWVPLHYQKKSSLYTYSVKNDIFK